MDKNIFIDKFKKHSGMIGLHITDDGRFGIGRNPLYGYKLDISIPSNTVMTGVHIGDGLYGFSMGNGTSDGFIPQIIGMGKSSTDPSLYFVGRCGDSEESNVPVIVMDARNRSNAVIYNRPLFGIVSNSKDCKFKIDSNGDTYIKGKLYVADIDVCGELNNIKNRLDKLEK